MQLDEKLEELIEKIVETKMVDIDYLPRVPLYMEQVLQFLDQEVGSLLKQNENCENMFTKTMINNYTKAGALSRPTNKKYDNEQIVSLIYISMLKKVLSISEMKNFFELLNSDQSILPLYKMFTEIVDEYRSEYRNFLSERITKIEDKLNAHGVLEDKNKAMLFIALMGLEGTINQFLCSNLLDEYQKEKEKSEEK